MSKLQVSRSAKTWKREFAVFGLYLPFMVMTGRMFILPPDASIIAALAPYYATFGGIVGTFLIASFGIDAYAKQVQQAQQKEGA